LKKALSDRRDQRDGDWEKVFENRSRTRTDYATTERAPPEPESRATVATKCRNRTARSRTAGSYQDRDTGKECSRILEFAMHRRPPRAGSIGCGGVQPAVLAPVVVGCVAPDLARHSARWAHRADDEHAGRALHFSAALFEIAIVFARYASVNL